MALTPPGIGPRSPGRRGQASGPSSTNPPRGGDVSPLGKIADHFRLSRTPCRLAPPGRAPPMAGDPSFYYAIFKKLQASTGYLDFGGGHLDPDDSPELSGGFSLRSPHDPNGLFHHLGPISQGSGLSTASQPLNPLSLKKELNPLYMMLSASLGTEPLPAKIAPINGEIWPVMPDPSVGNSIAANKPWVEFNSGPTKL